MKVSDKREFGDESLPYYEFQMSNAFNKKIMGRVSLILGGKQNNSYLKHWGNVGFYVEPEFRGHNLAARSC